MQFSQNFNEKDIDPVELAELVVEDDWRPTLAEIVDSISHLDAASAVGIDGVYPITIKKCCAQLAPALTTLLNRCLEEGVFPACWKHARVAPIPKVPGTSTCSEFRPISVLPVLSKIAERWIQRCIADDYLFNPPDENQFAYLKGCSIEDALALLQFYVSSGLNSCSGVTKVAVVSVDIKKAFDQVPRNSILKVLRDRLKLPPAFLHLISSYLSGRQQTTLIDGACSNDVNVVSGVAQGSILGPHLFISYISSVLNLPMSADTKLIAFADDLLIIKPIRSIDDSIALQSDIDTIIAEYDRLFLSVNPSKSKYLLCTLQTPATAPSLDVNLLINDVIVERVQVLRYLGVLLDPALSFQKHIDAISIKAKKAIGALNRTLRSWAGQTVFRKVYLAKILPILMFASPVACPTGISAMRSVERVHRFAARLAVNNFAVSYSALLSALEWKSWARTCTERQLLTVYKWVNGFRHLPNYVLCTRPQPLRQLRRASQNGRHQLSVNDEYFRQPIHGRIPFRNIDRTPLHLAVLAWNTLPPPITELDLTGFKRQIELTNIFSHLVRTRTHVVNLYNEQTYIEQTYIHTPFDS
ncbi:MAG: reverse transcriptase family protein [Gammaproteobacteria bacterium]|nr:reverse transcriptase family protein [Gammaproteobacteria bacterium]